MKFITEQGEEYVLVSSAIDLKEIINRISTNEEFAYQFRFSDRELFVALLELLKIEYDDFVVKYYYYNSKRRLHISESEFGYVWISTVGLVARNKSTSNRAVNACLNQYTVISLLLKKAIEIVNDEKVYDIDSYHSGLLSNLSPAIYHNLIFYVEVFCKAYLSLIGIRAPHTHSLSIIYKQSVLAMKNNNHNDSLFQILILDPLYKLVNHLGKIPGVFKEHFIKYDDNLEDDTVILFESSRLHELTHLLELSADFISDYYYSGIQTHYLRSNVYQRMLERADTEEKKQRIKELYSYLAANNENAEPSQNVS